MRHSPRRQSIPLVISELCPAVPVWLLTAVEISMRLILLTVVIVLLVGALPTWPYSSGWGYYPAGGLGTLLVILLILALLGVI